MQGDLKQLVESFVQDVAALVRQEALAQVEAALSGVAPSKKPPRGGNGVAKANGVVTAKGKKRDPEALAALVESLYKQIKKTPESSIEELSRAMEVPSKDLTLPAKKLIAEKRVKTKGQKRGTRYIAR